MPTVDVPEFAIFLAWRNADGGVAKRFTNVRVKWAGLENPTLSATSDTAISE